LRAVLAHLGLNAHRLNPEYFPSAAAYRGKLENAGFAVDEIAIVPRPTVSPSGLEVWLDTFTEDCLAPWRSPTGCGSRRSVEADVDG
jgi:hypothetical protein